MPSKENKSESARDAARAPLWSGRFAEAPDADAIAFETSIKVDSRLAQDDILGSVAHASMLGRQGIVPKEEAELIARTLERLRKS